MIIGLKVGGTRGGNEEREMLIWRTMGRVVKERRQCGGNEEREMLIWRTMGRVVKERRQCGGNEERDMLIWRTMGRVVKERRQCGGTDSVPIDNTQSQLMGIAKDERICTV